MSRSTALNISEAKARLPLPELMSKLGMDAIAKRSAKCPFHEDSNASFGIFPKGSDWYWKCHAGCGGGDEITFLEKIYSESQKSAIQRFKDLASDRPVNEAVSSVKTLFEGDKPSEPRSVAYPSDMRAPTREQIQEIAALRNLSEEPVAWLAHAGVLHVGTVSGFPSWILTDARRLCAEARRIDGAYYPDQAGLSKRKAHTLRGSTKSWPVGLGISRPDLIKHFQCFLLVEGGPDLIAALHFALLFHRAALPITILGAGAGTAIHSEALALLAGKRVRIYPHDDPGGQGQEAASKWVAQLQRAGCNVDAFDFSDLRKACGAPVKDVNDLSELHSDDLDVLEELIP